MPITHVTPVHNSSISRSHRGDVQNVGSALPLRNIPWREGTAAAKILGGSYLALLHAATVACSRLSFSRSSRFDPLAPPEAAAAAACSRPVFLRCFWPPLTFQGCPPAQHPVGHGSRHRIPAAGCSINWIPFEQRPRTGMSHS